MLAEIFMMRLEAAARLMEETIPSRASRFTPFIVGARFTAQCAQITFIRGHMRNAR